MFMIPDLKQLRSVATGRLPKPVVLNEINFDIKHKPMNVRIKNEFRDCVTEM